MRMKNIQPAVLGGGSVYCTRQVGVGRNVETNRFGFATAIADFGRNTTGQFGITVGDDDHRPPSGQRQGTSTANAGACGGQKSDLIEQKWGHRLRPRCKNACAVISKINDKLRTMVPMALISGVTPRRIEENT